MRGSFLFVLVAAMSCDAPSKRSAPTPAGSEVRLPGAGGPKSCDDVGRFSGHAVCCEGAYCAGECYTDGCRCGDVFAGCWWPDVCCNGACIPHGQCDTKSAR